MTKKVNDARSAVARWLFGILMALSFVAAAADVSAQSAATTPRTAFVHLFEWKWTDVARECETHLGPKGFAAVQVSPPTEHAWVATGDGAPYPWWMRYQPVSYSLDRSRSGTRAEFINMVNRCANAGVAIYVDAVINHMAGTATGVSSAGNAWQYKNYTRVPYSANDFHPSCAISPTDYNSSASNVWGCEVVNLQDLNTGSSYVQTKIADYLVDMVNIGVKGFRVDAAKHIAPSELTAIIAAVNSRVGSAKRPYWFLEVIGVPNQAVQPSMYFGANDNTANITEFQYGKELKGKFSGSTGKLADLKTFGPTWNLLPSERAVAFIDNHDNQRGHGGEVAMTYHWGDTYGLANVFMLAWPYGYPSIMSSFAFNQASAYDTSYGPPFNAANGATRGPWDDQLTSPRCFGSAVGDWVCEHRWRQIANMVGFRNAANANWQVSDWWDNGNNQIAFGRGSAGFVVINKEGAALTRTFKTSLPSGQYCNVIAFEFANGACTGAWVTVDASGYVTLSAPAMGSAAIHIGAKNSAPQPTSTVRFSVANVVPAAGESVYVVGSNAAIGAWNACAGVRLTLDASGRYAADVSVPASASLAFKYVKYSNCAAVTWESAIGDRQVTAALAGGVVSTCGVFNSTAACPVVTNVSVTFNETAVLGAGETLHVVGSTAALGAWNTAQAKPLTLLSGTTYRASVSMLGSTYVEYKYIKKNSAGAVTWESGSNRAFTSVASGSQSLSDTWK